MYDLCIGVELYDLSTTKRLKIGALMLPYIPHHVACNLQKAGLKSKSAKRSICTHTTVDDNNGLAASGMRLGRISICSYVHM